ncbi:hypothetical protein [Streptomyces solaniscabiei]|uniref:hypothetical protein n=1 Tax=Streptomyces solaniscabiei TaxID=2683255 RepID=UPI001CE27B82|nr:hypothetical protein [Streptomyces solaniscabiei]
MPAIPEHHTPPAESAVVDEPEPLGDPAPTAGNGRSRRRGRTALLIGAAAVMGLVAGACGGVLVQVGREPTKLPPLSQAALARGVGDAPKPLPAAQDRQVRTEGDLRDLLLKKPRGAEEADWLEDSDGWMGLTAYAGTFTDPEGEFEHLLLSEFRRAAVTGWEVDDAYSVEIRLVQYRQEEVLAAAEANDDGQYYAEGEGTDDWRIGGTGDGRAFVHNEPLPELAPASLYTAEAHARRGDIAMEIWVSGAKRIDKKMILDLAERQMERL